MKTIMKKNLLLLTVLTFVAFGVSAQKFSNLAPTPPMGWNSWNKFQCNVNETLIKETADAMVSTGLAEAGYQYVVIDDCWHGDRDSLGMIHENPETFPSGMKALADYIHSKNLKFGIYSCAGYKTCAGYPAGRGHEYQDAIQYAKWEVDYLKYDWCNSRALNAEGSYMTIRDALYAAGRPIVLSICEWGSNKPWKWASKYGQLWRTTPDIAPYFDQWKNSHGYDWDVMHIVDRQMSDSVRFYAGPNAWNDPDMLEVGNGMTVSEDRSHFTLWCILAAPLMLGNDLRNISQETLSILTNKEVIAIDQDPLGYEGWRISSENYVEIWAKPLKDSSWAVCFLNRSNQEKVYTIDWSKINVKDDFTMSILDPSSHVYNVRDVWNHKDCGTTAKSLTVTIPIHDVFCVVLK